MASRRPRYTDAEIEWVRTHIINSHSLDEFRQLFCRPEATLVRLRAFRAYKKLGAPKGQLKNRVAGVWVDGKSLPENRLEWERAHGPIPKGMVLFCNSNDMRDASLSNWTMLSTRELRRAVLLRREIGDDPELRPAIIALARLQTKLADRLDAAIMESEIRKM